MRWYWTPNGIILAIIAVGLLAGAAFVKNEVATNVMIVLGLLTILYGWARTYLNIKKINKEVEQEQRRKVQEAWNKENEEYFKKMANARSNNREYE